MKIECPRCSGSGIYTGFGVCYRCNGRKVVNAVPARKPQPNVAPLTHDELVAKVGEDLAEAAESYNWED